MDPKTYRKEYLEKLRNTAHTPAVSAIGDRQIDSEAASPDVQNLMENLADTNRPVAERLQAIQEINSIAFDQRRFQEHHADYDRLLKSLRTDSSSKVRTAVFERLALSLDQDTREMLHKTLAEDGKPLVPRHLAVTLLSMDDHASSREILRDIAENEQASTKCAAIRGLAADTQSASLLERVATDQDEALETRETAALSLKIASPKRFVKMAKKLATDRSEEDRIRATALSALAHNAETFELASTRLFQKQLDEIAKETKSRSLKSSIKQFQTQARLISDA